MASSASLPVEILRVVASYADPTTLKALDLTCREMRRLTDETWAMLALSSFGMKRLQGKKAWKAGVALARPPYSNRGIILRHPWVYNDAFSGSTVLAQNDSIMVFASDQHAHSREPDIFSSNHGDILACPIQVRDAKNLNVLRHIECNVKVWEIAICGAPGSEIVVVSTIRDVVAFKGNQSVTLHGGADGPDESKIIGKADALIVIRRGVLYVHHPAVDSPELLMELTCKIEIANPMDFECSFVAWSVDTSQFGFSLQDDHFCLWTLYDDAQEIRPCELQQFESPDPVGCYASLAFDEKLAMVTGEGFEGIDVYDRVSGTRRYRMADAYTVGSAHLGVMTGKYLIPSSPHACVPVIWDLTKGKPTYKKMFPADNDFWQHPTDEMVQLSGMGFHAFVETISSGELLLWGYPESQKDENHLGRIRKREAGLKENICRNILTLEIRKQLEILQSGPLDGPRSSDEDSD